VIGGAYRFGQPGDDPVKNRGKQRSLRPRLDVGEQEIRGTLRISLRGHAIRPAEHSQVMVLQALSFRVRNQRCEKRLGLGRFALGQQQTAFQKVREARKLSGNAGCFRKKRTRFLGSIQIDEQPDPPQFRIHRVQER
jgi:hypothetical protein